MIQKKGDHNGHPNSLFPPFCLFPTLAFVFTVLVYLIAENRFEWQSASSVALSERSKLYHDLGIDCYPDCDPEAVLRNISHLSIEELRMGAEIILPLDIIEGRGAILRTDSVLLSANYH